MEARDNAPLIAAGGGLLLLISLFISWIGEGSFWELYDIVDVLFALIALFAIAVGVAQYTGNPLNPPGGAGPALYASGLIAFSITAFHLLEGEERKLGIWLGLIGAGAIIWAGIQLGRAITTTTRTRATEPATTRQPPPPPPPPPASPTV